MIYFKINCDCFIHIVSWNFLLSFVFEEITSGIYYSILDVYYTNSCQIIYELW